MKKIILVLSIITFIFISHDLTNDKIYIPKESIRFRVIANSNSDDISSVKKSTTLKDDNFNKYRRILIQKGIIESTGYGKIEFVLPRFKEFLLTLQLYR